MNVLSHPVVVNIRVKLNLILEVKWNLLSTTFHVASATLLQVLIDPVDWSRWTQFLNNQFIHAIRTTTVKTDGTLSTAVYRKPTHTDHYLQFSSHHPLIHKLGVIRTLQYRADTVVSNDELVVKEKDHIKDSLNTCGYPNWAFVKATNKGSKQHHKNHSGQATRARATIPYISGISERVEKHFNNFGITTSFKPGKYFTQQISSREG